MRSSRLCLRACAMFVAMSFVAACGSGGGTTTLPPPIPPPVTPPTSGSEFYYQWGLNGIGTSTLNSSTGAATEPSYAEARFSPQPETSTPQATPSGRFLYIGGNVYDSTCEGVETGIVGFYLAGPGATLTPMPNVPYVTGNETQQTLTSGLQIDHAGKYLFYSVVESTAAAPGQASQAGVIYAFAIGSTGELTLQSRLVTQYGSGVGASAVDPLGRYVYFDVDTGDGPGVAVISVNSETGALSEVAGSPFVPTKTGPSADYGLDLVADPSGKFLYALQQTPDPNTSTVVSFSIDPNSGALDPVAGSPFPVAQNLESLPSWIELSPSGQFLYVVESGGISVFDVNGNAGTIGPQPVSTQQTQVDRIAIDPTGAVLAGSQFATQTLITFTIDPGTGSLTPGSGSPVPSIVGFTGIPQIALIP
ncbi:MAG: beta-propeller fold lactonase family protein [Candidatus Acidiferrales bacterium]